LVLKAGLESAELGPVGIHSRLSAGLERRVAVANWWVRFGKSGSRGEAPRPLSLSRSGNWGMRQQGCGNGRGEHGENKGCGWNV
jgi:hypothetical protein